MKFKKVKMKVRCPKCSNAVEGTVTYKIPFYDYFAECKCGYLITESEWDIVQGEP